MGHDLSGRRPRAVLTPEEARLAYWAFPPDCIAPTNAERPAWESLIAKLKDAMGESSPVELEQA